MEKVAPSSVETVISVVNGWSNRVRSEAGLLGEPFPSLWETDGLGPAGVDTDGRLAGIAARLHRVFDAAPGRTRRDALNEAIRCLNPTPVLTEAGTRWLTASQDAFEASLVLCLAECAQADPALTRLGTCRADRCADVYYDATQARTRRYCSATCQNRAKAAAYRRRQP